MLVITTNSTPMNKILLCFSEICFQILSKTLCKMVPVCVLYTCSWALEHKDLSFPLLIPSSPLQMSNESTEKKLNSTNFLHDSEIHNKQRDGGLPFMASLLSPIA